ncbi:unnamed protein product, partial [Amoebophrya sp. A25]|eukprot:GSA25T00026050001.1
MNFLDFQQNEDVEDDGHFFSVENNGSTSSLGNLAGLDNVDDLKQGEAGGGFGGRSRNASASSSTQTTNKRSSRPRSSSTIDLPGPISPASIAEYLSLLGYAAGSSRAVRRELSPFAYELLRTFTQRSIAKANNTELLAVLYAVIKGKFYKTLEEDQMYTRNSTGRNV